MNNLLYITYLGLDQLSQIVIHNIWIIDLNILLLAVGHNEKCQTYSLQLARERRPSQCNEVSNKQEIIVYGKILMLALKEGLILSINSNRMMKHLVTMVTAAMMHQMSDDAILEPMEGWFGTTQLKTVKIW